MPATINYRNHLETAFSRILEAGEFEIVASGVNFENGSSRPGYISLCDGAVQCYAKILLDAEAIRSLERMGISSNISDSMEFMMARNSAVQLCAEAEQYDIIQDNLDSWTPQEFRENRADFYDKLNGLENDIARETGVTPEDSSQAFMLSLGMVLNNDEKKPFYVFTSVNLDDPYFRSNPEILRNGKPVIEMDMLIAESESQIPKSEKEFEGILDSLLEKSFPHINNQATACPGV